MLLLKKCVVINGLNYDSGNVMVRMGSGEGYGPTSTVSACYNR